MIRTMLLALTLASLAGCWQNNVSRTYYPSGKLRTEATIQNYLLDGPAVMYYENGHKKSEAMYRGGLLNGKSAAYYESGAKKAEAEYTDGILNGYSSAWADNGQLQNRALFRDGRLISSDNSMPPPPTETPSDKAGAAK